MTDHETPRCPVTTLVIKLSSSAEQHKVRLLWHGELIEMRPDQARDIAMAFLAAAAAAGGSV